MVQNVSTTISPAPGERGKRGRLKIFLGYAPGVGKTFRLIAEAHSLREAGFDAVLGFIETHQQCELSSRLTGLEIVSRRRVEYRGIWAEELDLEGILSRHPQVVIIDEVAHTNAPDSRYRRRFEDVLEVLDQGIDVVCAFDVQHLESLNHLVERTVGVPIRESVPDSFLRQADQVVMVDLPVEDLLERRRAGKIGGAETKDGGGSLLFQAENLTSLRGLALREVSETLERSKSAPWGGGKALLGPLSNPCRVMVCLASASPRAQVLLYKGSRMAGRLNTHWFVVSVEPPGETAGRPETGITRALQATLESAREIGAEVVRLTAADPVQGILEFAASHGVRDIIIGRSHQPWWKQILGLSPVQRLLEQAAGFDVHVISFDEDERP